MIILFPGIDHIGNDIMYNDELINNIMIDKFKNIYNNNEEIVAFNTLGFIKNKVDLKNLKETDWINKNTPHGIYIKNKYL